MERGEGFGGDGWAQKKEQGAQFLDSDADAMDRLRTFWEPTDRVNCLITDTKCEGEQVRLVFAPWLTLPILRHSRRRRMAFVE